MCPARTRKHGWHQYLAARTGQAKHRQLAKIVDLLGGDVAEFEKGYARNYIVIKKGHFDDMAMVPTLLARQKGVQMVRAKNRFDPDYNALKETAGYRDYQVIIRISCNYYVGMQSVIATTIGTSTEVICTSSSDRGRVAR